MKVIIGADQQGIGLKNQIIDFLKQNNYDYYDVTSGKSIDFFDSTNLIVDQLNLDSQALGIAIDGYGSGSFMVATKHKNIIAAQVSDERSAYMTRQHNNSRLISLGSEIVGRELAINIVKEFLAADYDGGRHQIRVDMLNEMC